MKASIFWIALTASCFAQPQWLEQNIATPSEISDSQASADSPLPSSTAEKEKAHSHVIVAVRQGHPKSGAH